MKKSIEECKSINQVNKVLKEQGITISDMAFIYCQTITEIIAICLQHGAK